ncbi:hypothetical protein [Thiorhodococcus mannitoliphagus]|uniref:hypothetical protein n=1 Tax=Thiorhodococcus mannitoliphagus TaxID=329406 RepID=UPI001F10BFA4|nr:hypothetical protein [Thiorhodococcus mannitoliphagus]
MSWLIRVVSAWTPSLELVTAARTNRARSTKSLATSGKGGSSLSDRISSLKRPTLGKASSQRSTQASSRAMSLISSSSVCRAEACSVKSFFN